MHVGCRKARCLAKLLCLSNVPDGVSRGLADHYFDGTKVIGSDGETMLFDPRRRVSSQDVEIRVVSISTTALFAADLR
jgi:hypothetical protein